MIYSVMALYDTKARAFRTPFFVAHVDVGLRAVRGAVNNAEHELSQYAADFIAYQLGTFDDERGHYEQLAQPLSFGCIASLKAVDTRQGSLLPPQENV